MTALNGGTSGDQGLLGGFFFFFFFNHNGCVPHHFIFVTYISRSNFVKTPPPRLLSWPLHSTHKVISRPERGTEA